MPVVLLHHRLLSHAPALYQPFAAPLLGARFGAHVVNMSDLVSADKAATLMRWDSVEVPQAVSVATTTTVSELLAEKTSLSMRPVFNGQDMAARARTHRGKKRHDDTRLLHIYQDNKTPRMIDMDQVAAWTAVHAVLEADATAADAITGVRHRATDLIHIRSSGSCPVQPTNTDHPRPWLRNGAAPGFRVILALSDTTVHFWGGSHEIFRQQASLAAMEVWVGGGVARVDMKPLVPWWEWGGEE